MYARLKISKLKSQQSPQDLHAMITELVKIQREQMEHNTPAVAAMLDTAHTEKAEEEGHQAGVAEDEHREADFPSEN